MSKFNSTLWRQYKDYWIMEKSLGSTNYCFILTCLAREELKNFSKESTIYAVLNKIMHTFFQEIFAQKKKKKIIIRFFDNVRIFENSIPFDTLIYITSY